METLSYLLLVTFISRHIDIWVWDDYKSRCWFSSLLMWNACLLFAFCFLSGFSEVMMVVWCLFYCPSQLVCSQGMPAGVRGRNTEMSWSKEAWRRSLWSVWHGWSWGERKATKSVLLQSCRWAWGVAPGGGGEEDDLQAACLLPWQESVIAKLKADLISPFWLLLIMSLLTECLWRFS